MTGQGQVFRDETLFRAEEIVSACNGERLVLINELNEDPAASVIDRTGKSYKGTKIVLGDRPISITSGGDYAIISGSKGQVHPIDARNSKLAASIDLTKEGFGRAARAVFSADNKRVIVSIMQGTEDKETVSWCSKRPR